MRGIESDTIQGYACWAIAALLGLVVATVIVLSLIEWVS